MCGVEGEPFTTRWEDTTCKACQANYKPLYKTKGFAMGRHHCGHGRHIRRSGSRELCGLRTARVVISVPLASLLGPLLNTEWRLTSSAAASSSSGSRFHHPWTTGLRLRGQSSGISGGQLGWLDIQTYRGRGHRWGLAGSAIGGLRGRSLSSMARAFAEQLAAVAGAVGDGAAAQVDEVAAQGQVALHVDVGAVHGQRGPVPGNLGR